MAQSTIYNDDFGYVYETGATGTNVITGIWFRYASSLDEVEAIAYGIDEDGNAKRSTTLISGGLLTYDVLDDMWTCVCPFSNIVEWKLFIWKKNTTFSERDVSWTDGQTIPVSDMVNEINTLKSRAQEDTTSTGRSLRTPELGSNDLFIPPKDVRKGRFLGFDDDGFPAIGAEIQDYVDFMAQKDICKEYALESQRWAEESEYSATAAANSASEANSSRADAEKWADTAKKYANDIVATAQQVEQVAKDAIVEVDQATSQAVQLVETVAQNVVDESKDARDMAKEWADAANASAVSAEASADEAAMYARALSQDLRIEVYKTLPTTLESGVLYMIGDDSDGYDVYVKDSNGKTVYLYHTPYGIQPATQNTYGLVKLSASGAEWTLDEGSQAIGVDADGKLRARIAGTDRVGAVRPSYDGALDETNYRGEIGMGTTSDGGKIYVPVADTDRFGVVKLGASPTTMNASKYCVKIAALQVSQNYRGSNDGQLFFNIKSGGALEVSNNTLDVAIGSYDTRGVLYLLDSLDNYSEEEIEAARYTHAASVGLVLDGIDDFATTWFTDDRIYGYFDTWCKDKNLADEIWANGEYRQELITNLEEYMLSSTAFVSTIKTYTEDVALTYLKDVFTDDHIHELFDAQLYAEVVAQVDAHWTDRDDQTIENACIRNIKIQLPEAISEWFGDESNVANVAAIVSNSVVGTVTENASEAAVAFLKDVVNGKETIEIDGKTYLFREYIAEIIKEQIANEVAILSSQIKSVEDAVAQTFAPRIDSITKVLSGTGTTNIPTTADVLIVYGSNGKYVGTVMMNELRCMAAMNDEFSLSAQYYTYYCPGLGSNGHSHDYHEEMFFLIKVNSVSGSNINITVSQSSNSGGSISGVYYATYNKDVASS